MGLLDSFFGGSDNDKKSSKEEISSDNDTNYKSHSKDNYPEDDRDPTESSDTDGNVHNKKEQ